MTSGEASDSRTFTSIVSLMILLKPTQQHKFKIILSAITITWAEGQAKEPKLLEYSKELVKI